MKFGKLLRSVVEEPKALLTALHGHKFNVTAVQLLYSSYVGVYPASCSNVGFC